MALELMYITNSPEIAKIAEKNGVERIWVDLETLGKEERQKNRDTVKSHHTLKDVETISGCLTTSRCMVRINPWHEHSATEIEEVIKRGADRIMLPMWKSKREVGAFVSAVGQRVNTTLLLETKEAVECLGDVLALPGLDEIHIGLNDLHLSYGLSFMFELLANGTVERLCRHIAAAGIPYGFGGIARLGCGDVPAERIIMEHYRLGSTRAILSRSFCNPEKADSLLSFEREFSENMQKLRAYEALVKDKTPAELEANQKEVQAAVERITLQMGEK